MLVKKIVGSASEKYDTERNKRQQGKKVYLVGCKNTDIVV